MDPVSGAVVGFLKLLGATGAGAVVKKGTEDLYQKLKERLLRKDGDDGELAEAVLRLEAKPESDGRQNVLAEEVAAVQADRDEALLALARELTAALGQTTGGTNVQRAEGNFIAQAGPGGTASVNAHKD